MDKEKLKIRLLKKISKNPNTLCWEWMASKSLYGYGRIRIDGKLYLPHRVSFEIFNKKSPGDLMVCHKCDNPGCINPDHLFLGTRSDNMKDCSLKGRLGKIDPEKYVFGESVGSSKLKNKDIPVIRSLLKKGVTQTDIAKRFKVNKTQINRIFLGKTWSKVK